MAVIEDVPPEILSKILLHVINGLYVHQRARFMCSLSTLSRQFYFVLQPLIFRRVHIAFQPGPARCALLFRSLNEDPSLIEMVHDLGVSWLLPVREKPNNEADELLKILTSLRSLLIHSKWNHEHFPTQFLDVNPMRNLTTVTLRGLQLTPDDIRKYLVLDHVEHMTIGCPFVGDFSESIDIDGKTSRLLSLYIHSASHIPPELLLNILKICPKIVELRCAPPGRGVQQGLDDSTLRLGDRLSPELISKALSPSKSTLQRLELVPSPCEWPGHDGSRMDLSMMKALRYIHCPSQCFFIPRTPFNTRVGLYGLLPSCLEELSIYFENCGGLESWGCPVSRAGTGGSAEFLWLLELASNKAEYTPKLKRLRLEGYDILDLEDGGPSMEPWYPPRVIVETLAKAGIQFMADNTIY